jgi:hypothetical protein
LAIASSIFLLFTLLITPLVSSNVWPLHCLSFLDLQLLITPLASSNFWPLGGLSLLDLRFWLPLWYLQTFGHCVVCPS